MVLTLVLAGAIAIAVLNFFGQSHPKFLYIYSNGLPPFLALTALVPAMLVVRKYGPRTSDKWSTMWLCYAIGLLLWFIAETTWAYFTLWLLTPIPYPSLADFFWLSGYPFLIYGLFSVSWPFRGSASTKNLRIVSALQVILAIFILGFLIPPILSEHDVLTIAVGLAYPLLDVLLLSLAIGALLLFRRGTFWKPMLLIAAAVVLTLVGDVLFSFATLTGQYYEGHPLELFFLWSYLAFFGGFYLELKRV